MSCVGVSCIGGLLCVGVSCVGVCVMCRGVMCRDVSCSGMCTMCRGRCVMCVHVGRCVMCREVCHAEIPKFSKTFTVPFCQV